MRLLEITAMASPKEFKAGKEVWKTPEFRSDYYQSGKYLDMGGKFPGLPAKDVANLFKYVRHDVKPTGGIAQSLDLLVELSPPLTHNIVSYRGMTLPSAQVDKITAALKNKKSFTFSSPNPSSFTNAQKAAWNFAKKAGYRATAGRIGIILEIMIPAGTKVGRLEISFGVGSEHVLASNTRIELTKVRPYREGFIFTGVAS